jgi:hypothetical protein
MKEPCVWVFFYGSYINFDVLKEVDLVPPRWEVARIMGFDIEIAPRANLIRTDQHVAYGIIAQATHSQLARLYSHAKDVLGEVYLPEAVNVQTVDGKWIPAMTYLCPEMEPRQADEEYVERIAAPALKFGFPSWYIDRIDSFRPSRAQSRKG